MSKKPCRQCDEKEVRITRREFKALCVAAKNGSNLSGQLADARLEIQRLRSCNADPDGEFVSLHRDYGEPWKFCWLDASCPEFELEHGRFVKVATS